MGCPARGQIGEGNITIHSQKRQRYWCKVCKKAFSARAGTVFYRRRTSEDMITDKVSLVGHGCPISAIERTFGIQAQTVREWVEAAGAHAEAVHHAEVVQPRDLGQVQADEILVKTQAGVVWMAMAMMVSTRLWLGGAVSAHRDRDLNTRLVTMVAACAQWGPLLFVTDGLVTYIDAVRKAFRTRQSGTGGRPRLVPWPDLVIAQVVSLCSTSLRWQATRKWAFASFKTAFRRLALTFTLWLTDRCNRLTLPSACLRCFWFSNTSPALVILHEVAARGYQGCSTRCCSNKC
jgi:transposase-like protein